MQTLDLKKENSSLYAASEKKVAVIHVPKMQYITCNGRGDPSSSKEFQSSIQVIFAVARSLQSIVKEGPFAIDYGIMPLEGLYWNNDMTAECTPEDRSNWHWKLMIMQPKFIDYTLVKQAIEENIEYDASNKILLEELDEGFVAQILHRGPYSEERSTIVRLHAFVEQNNYVFNGLHHDIYLNNPHDTAPEDLETIIRRPVKRVSTQD